MARSAVALLAAASLCAAAGCGTDNLTDYAAFGPSADEGLFATLAIDLPPVFVCGGADAEADKAADSKETLEERQASDYRSLKWVMDDTIIHRPSAPGFRQLCDLLNRHFGEWQRLVIIERLGSVVYECGFVAIAVTADGPKAATNLRRSGDVWNDSIYPRAVRIDAHRFQACLAELDRARKVLPQRLFWFDNVDWPVFVLHDVKADDVPFSFAVCGPFGPDDRSVPLPPPALEYAKAARVVGKEAPQRSVDDGTPRAKELREAGGVYAALMALVWESSLGPRDYMILGDHNNPTSSPPPESPKAPPECPAETPPAMAAGTARGNETVERKGR